MRSANRPSFSKLTFCCRRRHEGSEARREHSQSKEEEYARANIPSTTFRTTTRTLETNAREETSSNTSLAAIEPFRVVYGPSGGRFNAPRSLVLKGVGTLTGVQPGERARTSARQSSVEIVRSQVCQTDRVIKSRQAHTFLGCSALPPRIQYVLVPEHVKL